MKLLSPFIKIVNQLRVYHWQTSSYAEHKAFGNAYDNLNVLVDDFIESYLGRFGKTAAKIVYKFELTSYDENYTQFIDDSITFLTNLSLEVEESASDLMNIRDEMIAVLTKLKYLTTLK